MLPDTRLLNIPKSIAPSTCDVCSHFRFGLPLLVASTPPWGASPNGYVAPVLPASVINEVYGPTPGLPCNPQPSRTLKSENGPPCMNDSRFRFHDPEIPGNAAHLWPVANLDEPS